MQFVNESILFVEQGEPLSGGKTIPETEANNGKLVTRTEYIPQSAQHLVEIPHHRVDTASSNVEEDNINYRS